MAGLPTNQGGPTTQEPSGQLAAQYRRLGLVLLSGISTMPLLLLAVSGSVSGGSQALFTAEVVRWLGGGSVALLVIGFLVSLYSLRIPESVNGQTVLPNPQTHIAKVLICASIIEVGAILGFLAYGLTSTSAYAVVAVAAVVAIVFGVMAPAMRYWGILQRAGY